MKMRGTKFQVAFFRNGRGTAESLPLWQNVSPAKVDISTAPGLPNPLNYRGSVSIGRYEDNIIGIGATEERIDLWILGVPRSEGNPPVIENENNAIELITEIAKKIADISSIKRLGIVGNFSSFNDDFSFIKEAFQRETGINPSEDSIELEFRQNKFYAEQLTPNLLVYANHIERIRTQKNMLLGVQIDANGINSSTKGETFSLEVQYDFNTSEKFSIANISSDLVVFLAQKWFSEMAEKSMS